MPRLHNQTSSLSILSLFNIQSISRYRTVPSYVHVSKKVRSVHRWKKLQKGVNSTFHFPIYLLFYAGETRVQCKSLSSTLERPLQVYITIVWIDTFGALYMSDTMNSGPLLKMLLEKLCHLGKKGKENAVTF